MYISEFVFPEAPLGPVTDGQCGVCGIQGQTGFFRNELLDVSSSNTTVLFPFNTQFICRYCVGMWKEPKKWHRSVFALPGKVQFPVISSDSEAQDRPTWSSVFRMLADTDPGIPRVLVCTTDPKKRVWPRARVSSGPYAQIYIHDPSGAVSDNRTVLIRDLASCLALVEYIYSQGFTKEHIRKNLLSYQKLCLNIGYIQASRLENLLSFWRPRPEFYPAVLVAQKLEKGE